ncbi:MAG: histidine phosphatase family protein [Candidatus Lambdaproteobacteria bacterium]|nr:histidine phosphatase family protein [Candidatus Lambdaproteobacteria bacterium]
MIRIFLVRHGETLQNRDEVVQGQDPTWGRLTERGVRQAHLLGKALALQPFDIAYCSPLERCVITLSQVLLARAGERTLPLAFASELREINLGPFQGRPRAEWRAANGGDLLHYRPLGGESWHDVQVRVGAYLRRVVQPSGHRNILIVAHGGVNRGMLAEVTGVSIGELFQGGPLGLPQGNACVNLLELDAGGATLRVIANDTRHLAEEMAGAGAGLHWNADRRGWDVLTETPGAFTGP